MIQLFSQMLKLPLAAFVFSMEMLVRTMQGIQKIAYQSIDVMADGVVHPVVNKPDRESAVTSDATDGTIGDSAETMQLEERKMAEKDLHDDMLKLVRYKILFVKRDFEYAFGEQEELVAENMDSAAYTAWKVAQFIQKLQDDKKPTEVPETWKNYPPDDPKYRVGNRLKGLPDDDKKYLRVYYEVLERYSRERFRYEEEQIEVLKDIRDGISKITGV